MKVRVQDLSVLLEIRLSSTEVPDRTITFLELAITIFPK